MKLQKFKAELFKGKDKGLLIESIKVHTPDFSSLLKTEAWFDKDLKAFQGLFNRSLVGSNNLPKTYLDLNKGQTQYFSNSLERELNWQVLGFLKYSQRINSFLRLRTTFEHNLLLGEYSKAREILDEIESTICVSYWGIENRLILDDRQFGSEKNWETRNLMVDEKNFANVRVFSDFYSRRAESKYSFFQFNEYFNNWIAFLSRSDHKLTEEAEEYFRFKGNYFSSENYENLDFICFQEVGTSLIDRYIMFIRIIQHLIVKDNSESKYLKNLLEHLGAKIIDPHLNNIAISKFDIQLDNNLKPDILTVIDLYSVGRYEECVVIGTKFLIEVEANNFEVLLLIIKACIEANREIPIFPNEGSIIAQLSIMLFNILSKNEHTEASFIDMLKLSYVFSNSRFGLSFYAFVGEQFGWTTDINHTYLSRLNSSFVNPALVYNIYTDKDNVIAFNSRLSEIYGDSITVKLFKQFSEKFHNQPETEQLDIPDTKRKVYQARNLLLRENLAEAVDLYLEILQNENISKITEYESISNLFHCYFQLGDLHNCLKVYANAYLEKSEMTTRMTTNSLIDEIVKGKFKNIQLDKNLIELPIFFKLNCKDKIRIKQSYEIFLRANEASKPSDLREIYSVAAPEKLVYFLRNVCIPDILQLSKVFASSYLVNEERIKICQWLVILDGKNTKYYNEEIAAITQKNAISKVIGRIDEGKIYVNEEKIKQIFLNTDARGEVSKLNAAPIEKHLTKDFFNRTRDLQKFMENNEYKDVSKIVYMNYDTEGNFQLQGNPAFSAFRKMFLEVRDYFVTNNEYGLNPYLSTRIRHGTLPNHIRSVFERLNLVTTQSDGIYANNEFWENKLQLSEFENQKIQKLLADFSKSVDEISGTLKEEWIQYKTETKFDKQYALFDYDYKNDTDLLTMFITKFKTFDEFIDFCFSELWSRTEKCLEKIRNVLNTEIKQKFTDLITELEQQAESCSDKTKIYELINNINLSRTEIQILITNIAKWFYRSESSFDGEYELSMLAETSIQIIKNINPYYNFTISAEVCNNFNVKGEYHEYFIDVMRNFLENMIKRSNLQISELKPQMKIVEVGGLMIMNFGNNLSPSLDLEKLRKKMQTVKDNWSNLDSNISDEDGTGFPKIKKALHSDLDRASTTFGFSLSEDRLEIELSFETHGLKV